MKIAVLGLLLACGGCSLYFGDSSSTPDKADPAPFPPPDPDGPVKGPPPQPPISDPPCKPGPNVPDTTTCDGAQVQVFAVYETLGSNSNKPGEGSVSIEQPGAYRLVLSSYEPTNWHVALAPGATVEAVYLYGYHQQTVDLVDVPVAMHTFATGDYGCGYSYPYNGQGCDTNDLLARVEAEAGPVRGFHGCYRAPNWALRPDGTAKSDCATDAGYVQYDFAGQTCKPPSDWERAPFQTYDKATCDGDRYVRFDPRYGAWVGAILCGSADHYKLYMSEKREGVYLQIADYAGHGQDHCELVNPGFTLTSEDDITSGGCDACSLGDLIDVIGSPVYARNVFGEPFARVIARKWGDLTTNVYACGVEIQ